MQTIKLTTHDLTELCRIAAIYTCTLPDDEDFYHIFDNYNIYEMIDEEIDKLDRIDCGI